MLIDCDGCAMRGPGCPDCVVTVLLGASPGPVELDEVERQALAVLADGGLLPPLRLVPLNPPVDQGEPADEAGTKQRRGRAARPDGGPRHAAG
jgi:hypothetical protein